LGNGEIVRRVLTRCCRKRTIPSLTSTKGQLRNRECSREQHCVSVVPLALDLHRPDPALSSRPGAERVGARRKERPTVDKVLDDRPDPISLGNWASGVIVVRVGETAGPFALLSTQEARRLALALLIRAEVSGSAE
jgi:hypothetical protein